METYTAIYQIINAVTYIAKTSMNVHLANDE